MQALPLRLSPPIDILVRAAEASPTHLCSVNARGTELRWGGWWRFWRSVEKVERLSKYAAPSAFWSTKGCREVGISGLFLGARERCSKVHHHGAVGYLRSRTVVVCGIVFLGRFWYDEACFERISRRRNRRSTRGSSGNAVKDSEWYRKSLSHE